MVAANLEHRLMRSEVDESYLKEKIDRIESQCRRAARSVQQMKVFGRNVVDNEVCHLSIAVRDACELLASDIKNSGIKIVIEDNGSGEVAASPTLIEQIVINLLFNARDAIVEHRESLSGLRKIQVSVAAERNIGLITVQDTGGGIPSDIMPRIFEPFFTTKAVGKGTGLGLAVCYGILRDLGGTIEVENVEDGAVFKIQIPLLTKSSREHVAMQLS